MSCWGCSLPSSPTLPAAPTPQGRWQPPPSLPRRGPHAGPRPPRSCTMRSIVYSRDLLFLIKLMNHKIPRKTKLNAIFSPVFFH
uniref:Uncharacterized protein n=1 Tax=Oryza brachyantha TaxID=4533 RepID=J3M4Y4_ORYBR